jgi:hypothetical protein
VPLNANDAIVMCAVAGGADDLVDGFGLGVEWADVLGADARLVVRAVVAGLGVADVADAAALR